MASSKQPGQRRFRALSAANKHTTNTHTQNNKIIFKIEDIEFFKAQKTKKNL